MYLHIYSVLPPLLYNYIISDCVCEGWGGEYTKSGAVGAALCVSEKKVYFTASLRAFAARIFGTRMAGTWTVSPVRGFRASRAFRILASKIPNPAIDTWSPSFIADVIESKTQSTARSASAFVVSSTSCTLLMRSALFIGLEIISKASVISRSRHV